MKTFFAYLENKTDSADDEVIKIAAKNKTEAEKIALEQLNHRFRLRDVYTRDEIKKYAPYWHRLLWGAEPIKE